MAKLTGLLSTIDLYTSTTDVPGPELIGQRQPGLQGKEFRYVKAGASALVVGNVLQSPAIDTQFTNMAVPAAVASGVASGAAVTVTNGTTVLTGNEFVGGSLSIYVTPGLCEEYTILGNGAAANGAALNVYLDRPIRTAWTTATKINMRFSSHYGVIQSPVTTLTGSCVGVAIYAIPAGAYGWIQTHGVASVLSDASTGLVGSAVEVSLTVAGAVAIAGTSSSSAVTPRVGIAKQALASGKGISVELRID